MKNLQKFLGVEPDGFIGPKTLASATAYLKSKNMLPSCGVIAFRSSRKFTNRFDDYLCAVENSEIVEIIHGTSKPGRASVLNFSKWNKTGVGFWKPGVLNIGSHVFDKSPNKYGMPMFKQRKPIAIYRDGNKDDNIDSVNPEMAGPECTFQLHCMSVLTGFVDWSKALVEGWSAGCMGAVKSEWAKLIRHFNHGDVVSTGVVEW